MLTAAGAAAMPAAIRRGAARRFLISINAGRGRRRVALALAVHLGLLALHPIVIGPDPLAGLF